MITPSTRSLESEYHVIYYMLSLDAFLLSTCFTANLLHLMCFLVKLQFCFESMPLIVPRRFQVCTVPLKISWKFPHLRISWKLLHRGSRSGRTLIWHQFHVYYNIKSYFSLACLVGIMEITIISLNWLKLVSYDKYT